MTTQVDLLASYWTMASGAVPHSDHEYSSAAFEDRVAAAARAGFTGFGIWHADLEHTLRRISLADMRRILDDHGIKHVELEFLSDWWLEDGERRAASDVAKRKLLEAAHVLGARHVKVGDLFNSAVELPELVEGFAALCSEAREYGTKILFELMPFARINTLADALELVTSADAPNGGIVFDLWHLVKLGISYEDVARFPLRFIGGVEINDGTFTAPWTLFEDTINHRRLCGEGEFDVRGFVKTMLTAGYEGPWGIEVLNSDLRTWSPQRIAERAAATTRAQFPT
ncbi:MAG: sugar phosphate isomerase/epimerase family protein [Steroidobacteraceae bacterium]|jgi:sugar phosphate isomerase/epimerase